MGRKLFVATMILPAVALLVFFALRAWLSESVRIQESERQKTDEIISGLIDERQETDKIIADLKKDKQQLCNEIQQLYDEKLESARNLEELKRELYRNHSYEMFYGEWEVADIYVDPVPLRGYHYSEEDLKWFNENVAEWVETKSIQYTRNSIVINNQEVIENIKYSFKIFPAKDEYMLHFSIKLKDIGLTQTKGDYFVFVEVVTAEEIYYEGSRFFVKDENTLIAYEGSYCIEYIRTSYEGGAEEPVIIIG